MMEVKRKEEEIKNRINELKELRYETDKIFDSLMQIFRKLSLMPSYYALQNEILNDIEARINKNRIELSILRGDL